MPFVHPSAETYFGIPGYVLSWVILIAALALFSCTLYQRILLLRSGQPDPRFSQLDRRFLGLIRYGLIQKKQLRYFGAGIIHYLIFTGFIILSLRSLDLIIQGLGGGYELYWLKGSFGGFYNSLKDVFELLVLAAGLWAILRRLLLQPERYRRNGDPGHQSEAYLVLGLIVFLMITDILFEAGRLASTSQVSRGWLPAAALGAWTLSGSLPSTGAVLSSTVYWLHLLAFFFFLNFLPLAKHFHIITALPNVFFRKLEKGGIKPARWGIENPEDLDSLGVGRLTDFTWKHLLDFFSCTECGRCSDQCPARAVGRPLSPKMFTIKLRDYGYSKEENKIAMTGGLITTDEIWSCTTCGACEEECPVCIEYIDKMIDLRRHLIETSQTPKSFNSVLMQIEKTGNPFGKPASKRADWTKEVPGLLVPILKAGDEAEVLYFVDGYASYDPRVQIIAQAIVQGLHRSNIQFGILGAREKDSGHQVRRLGEEGLFQNLLEENMETLGSRRFKQIVTTDPHAFNTLKKDYPGDLPVMHYSQFFLPLIQDGRLKPAKALAPGDVYTYHDPCYLGRHNGLYDPPRQILKTLPGMNLVEMQRCRDRSFCCGGGDVNLWHEIEGEEMRMAGKRVRMARDAGANVIVTACLFCLLNLEDAVKTAGLDKEMRVTDLMELVVSTI
ncbi:MAG: (Fe-S)-binding protein [Deltaproteobacteria bacterium]|nr:(Fe-S)-binding protein [Deltaproteobacteria bacterium]